ncbi:MAG: hypothetical protein ACI9WU_003496 [Myxococcota bacterium]|jgi:hypothetical protein
MVVRPGWKPFGQLPVTGRFVLGGLLVLVFVSNGIAARRIGAEVKERRRRTGYCHF